MIRIFKSPFTKSHTDTTCTVRISNQTLKMQLLELFWGMLSSSRTCGALQGPRVKPMTFISLEWAPRYHLSCSLSVAWYSLKLQSKSYFGVIMKYYTKWCIISPNLQSANILIRIYYISYGSALQSSEVYVESTKSSLHREGRTSIRWYGSAL